MAVCHEENGCKDGQNGGHWICGPAPVAPPMTDPAFTRPRPKTLVTNPMRPPANCRGPVGITRRNMLQVGAIGALNLTLPRVLAAGERRSREASAPAADSCILVFLNGGPSHLDMWDMKPELPKEMRSEFRPIASSVPGIQVCEHLPRLSRLMDHCTLVRSVHHKEVA